MKVFKLEAEILDEKFEINSLFGMEAYLKVADERKETLGDMFAKIGKSFDSNNNSGQGMDILIFAKQITYQGYLSYCTIKDIEPIYSEKKVSIIFDNAGDLEDTILRWGTVFMETLPSVKSGGNDNTKKKK